MKLVIAEKPSVAKDIANIIGAKTLKEKYYEGNNYIVTWAVGHLLTLKTPEMYSSFYEKWKLDDLPIIPSEFQYYLINNTKSQFKVIETLWNREDVDTIICSTDAGREGELIFRLISNKINVKKNMQRLWISSLTEEAITEGFSNLKPLSNYDNLYLSALARQQADWIVGINSTRLYSIKAHTKLTSGRVQTPTLNLIVKRQQEINNFIKSFYYNIVAEFDGFEAVYSDSDNNSKFAREQAESVKTLITSSDFTVMDIKSEEKKIDRPKLFDLTSLQREANKKYSYTASKTLDLTQSLYEKWKVVTYPRTDSNCLSEDMKEPVKNLIFQIKNNNILDCQKYYISSDNMIIDKRTFDNSKVSDHHAIIPTTKALNTDLSKLSSDELNIFTLIFKRFLEAFSQQYTYNETNLSLVNNNLIFISKFKNCICKGWKEISSEEEIDNSIPESINNLKIGDSLKASDIKIVEKEVSPPKPYTEDTLLSAMENCKKLVETDSKEFLNKGIGTPATRAEVIEKLVQVDYIKREKKNLIPTEKGINFIKICDEKLKSIEISAEWEEQLYKIEHGKLEYKHFLNSIENYIKDVIKTKNSINSELFKKQQTSVGKCPICNNDIIEGKNNYYCIGYKEGCTFSISKIIANKTLTNKNVVDLIKNGSTAKIRGFKSKTGKSFDAKLVFKDNKIQFDFS